MTVRDLAIVVGTFNRLDRLRACVESVLGHCQRLHRLYVTDAGSTDGTVAYLESLDDPRVDALLVGEKLGQARAYNEVFDRLDCRYVAWLSDDNVVIGDGLDRAATILDGEAAIGMVGLKVRDVQGPFAAAPYIGGISSVGILNVNQGLLRTDILQGLGGFDEAFRDYGIDPDLTTRVLLAGHEVVYTRDVVLHHFRDWAEAGDGAAYKAHRAKLCASRDLYRKRYDALDRGGSGFRVKTVFGRLFKRLSGKRLTLNSEERFLGQLPRDWHNAIAGRYISLLDGLYCRGRPYHLRQRMPKVVGSDIHLEAKRC